MSKEFDEFLDGVEKQTMYERYQEYLKWLNEPTEISDEEIREQAIKYDNETTYETPIVHFIEGAKWYREQIKQKK